MVRDKASESHIYILYESKADFIQHSLVRIQTDSILNYMLVARYIHNYSKLKLMNCQ